MKIGDWCVFKNTFETDNNNKSEYVLGNILSFQMANGKTYKERVYSWDFVEIKENEKANQIEVMALWQKLTSNGQVSPFSFPKCEFISVKYYFAHLSENDIEKDNDRIFISAKHVDYIKSELQNI